MNLKQTIGLLLTGTKYSGDRLDAHLSVIPQEHLKLNIDVVPLRFESITKQKPGNFAMLQLHTDIVNYLRTEFEVTKSKSQVDTIIKLCQEKVMFYHNAQFDDSNRNTELPETGKDVGSEKS